VGSVLRRCSACEFVTRRTPGAALAAEGASERSFLDDLRFRFTARSIERALREHGLHSGDPLLEVGFGKGQLFSHFLDRGWSMYGVEPNRASFEHVQQRLGARATLFHGTIENVDWPANHFGAVYLIHVIEHVPDFHATVARIYRLLKPGGVLFLITPDAASQGLDYFGPAWWYLEDPTHIQFFTPRSISLLCEGAGFEIADISKQLLESLTLEARSKLAQLGRRDASPWVRLLHHAFWTAYYLPRRIVAPAFRPSLTMLARKP
jgi:ubiquinone/menaquinone biosynthesis C-methylase UbiE